VPRHRYFHAATEASSAVDLLKASRHVLRSLRVRRSGELFTLGFSQGGHSALALHRALERRGVEVTATAPVGGVFDVERFFLSCLANTTTVTLPLSVAPGLFDMEPWSGCRASITSTAGSRPCPARWTGSGLLTERCCPCRQHEQGRDADRSSPAGRGG
jgi:hypothetical protein